MQIPARGDLERVMVHWGVDEATATRALSLAPASALVPKRGTGLALVGADRVSADGGVTVPWWLLTLGIGFGFGAVLGPAIYASSKAGSQKLAEIARRKIG